MGYRRRDMAALLGALCLAPILGGEVAAAVTGATPSAPAPAAQPPNVVFILVDDLDARSLDDNLDLFPNIATLRREGANFEQFLATTPLCCPSRASILRGQYAHNHGVLQNGGQDGGFQTFHRLDREESTLATWLKTAGYRTGFFGKYLNGYPETASPNHVPVGWDDWNAFAYDTGEELDSFYWDYTLVENGRRVAYGSAPEDYSTDVIAAKATAFAQSAAAADTPFFALIAPYAPHQPVIPAERHADLLGDLDLPLPTSFAERDVSDKPAFVRDSPSPQAELQEELMTLRRDRLRSLLAVDELVGSILSTLRDSSVLEDTYVVFASDNGFLLGEHRLWHGKQAPYEESIRVPLIVRGPGIAAGLSIDDLAQNIDLAPTIGEWAGAATAGFVDGRSIAPLLSASDPDGVPWRAAALIENFRVPRERERRRDEETIARGSPPVPPYRALRTETLLYVEYETGERELYDLARDPDQLESLAATASAAEIERLSQKLERLRDCAADACRSAEGAPLETDA